MADHQKSALEFLQIFLQPLGHDDIQMVGGLVQNHEVRIAHQSCRQHEARLLPAAQIIGLMAPPFFRISQADEHPLNAIFKIIPIDEFVAFGHAGIFIQALIQRLATKAVGPLLQLRQSLAQGRDLRAGLTHELPNGAVNFRETLLHIAHADTGLEFDSALINPIRVEQAAQQRGFATAVNAH